MLIRGLCTFTFSPASSQQQLYSISPTSLAMHFTAALVLVACSALAHVRAMPVKASDGELLSKRCDPGEGKTRDRTTYCCRVLLLR
jgi:hypothetical protein